ncbi:MAG TPA: alanine--glyoxylate aminotransferase family protein [Gemmatimonadaceae bacterium]|nr:alanine--glyoxylate aminotransferase family protein [Gemmatimonadaceae bacterium]
MSEPLLLMTPGPTRVPERVLRAGARAMIHHRTAEFSSELGAAIEMLGPVFGTTSAALPVHTTGRGATEAAISNLFSPGDEIIACCNGKFGEMWADLAASYGLVVHRAATDWSREVDAAEIDALLRERPSTKAVSLTYGDTSTGVCNDIAAVARVARDRDVLVMVDGVSSIGGMPFAFDEWGVDVAVVASQKCLMSAPGLAFVAVSERAWAAYGRGTLPRNYWNFLDIKRHVTQAKPETPGTTPVSLILQVAEALRMIHEEGLDRVYARHEAMAELTRRRIAELGLTLQMPTLAHHSSTLTAIACPDGVAPKAIRDPLRARGILTAAGLGPYEPNAFRIGHMGDIRIADVERTVDALAEVLSGLSSATPRG